MPDFKAFRAIPELCFGCFICEQVCSLRKTGTVNPAYARLWVHRSDQDGAYTPIICRHCRPAPCQGACPVPQAMFQDERTGAWVIDEAKCIGCLACADACPFKAIIIGPQGEVLKCDLCGGQPVCVEYCPPRPEEQFPHLPYPNVSCLEYEEPHRIAKKRPERRQSA